MVGDRCGLFGRGSSRLQPGDGRIGHGQNFHAAFRAAISDNQRVIAERIAHLAHNLAAAGSNETSYAHALSFAWVNLYSYRPAVSGGWPLLLAAHDRGHA